MTALRLIRKLLCSSLLAGQLKLVLPCWGHVDCRDENINLVYRRPDHRGHISDGLRFSSDIDPLRISWNHLAEPLNLHRTPSSGFCSVHPKLVILIWFPSAPAVYLAQVSMLAKMVNMVKIQVSMLSLAFSSKHWCVWAQLQWAEAFYSALTVGLLSCPVKLLWQVFFSLHSEHDVTFHWQNQREI